MTSPFLVAFGLIVTVSALAVAQSRQFSPNSFALKHSIAVIGPNSPHFRTLLDKDFPGVSGVQYFQAVKPVLAIVHNNTRRVVVAYVVKWTTTNADGTTSTAMLPVVGEPLGQWALAGERTVLGPTGTGRGTELVSPYFHWKRGWFAATDGGSASSAFSVAARFERFVALSQKAASVRVMLDAAIFGDGVCVGPDTSKLFEKFQAMQKAEVDEATWTEKELNSGVTDQRLKDLLSQQIYDGRNASGADYASFYAVARAQEAERFLDTLGREGQGGLRAAAGRVMAVQRRSLSKQANP